MKLFIKTTEQSNLVKFIEMTDESSETNISSIEIENKNKQDFISNIIQHIENYLPYYSYSTIYFVGNPSIKSVLDDLIQTQDALSEFFKNNENSQIFRQIYDSVGVLETPIKFIPEDQIIDYGLVGL